jgi:hypothetical protein
MRMCQSPNQAAGVISSATWMPHSVFTLPSAFWKPCAGAHCPISEHVNEHVDCTLKSSSPNPKDLAELLLPKP